MLPPFIVKALQLSWSRCLGVFLLLALSACTTVPSAPIVPLIQHCPPLILPPELTERPAPPPLLTPCNPATSANATSCTTLPATAAAANPLNSN